MVSGSYWCQWLDVCMYVSIPVVLKVYESKYCGPSCMAQWVLVVLWVGVFNSQWKTKLSQKSPCQEASKKVRTAALKSKEQ